MSRIFGHSCPKCGKRWAANRCFEPTELCSGEPTTCPRCDSTLGWATGEWKDVEDPFVKWVKEVRK